MARTARIGGVGRVQLRGRDGRVRAAYDSADWARLVALKDRYDPENRFRFSRNIAQSR